LHRLSPYSPQVGGDLYRLPSGFLFRREMSRCWVARHTFETLPSVGTKSILGVGLKCRSEKQRRWPDEGCRRRSSPRPKVPSIGQACENISRNADQPHRHALWPILIWIKDAGLLVGRNQAERQATRRGGKWRSAPTKAFIIRWLELPTRRHGDGRCTLQHLPNR
jgi:hypothetical protein